MAHKILVVDDAAFMRMMVKDTIIKNNLGEVEEAVDGADAVEKFMAINPDLVIMDITMPNKNGLEALKEMKAARPTSKVVMCSAMGQEAMVVDAIKAGAADFIVKPFKAERIIKTVQDLLG